MIDFVTCYVLPDTQCYLYSNYDPAMVIIANLRKLNVKIKYASKVAISFHVIIITP